MKPFIDLEIRIFQQQDAGYPVEITLGGQQEFPRGYLSAGVLPWTASGDSAADGQQLLDTLLADPALRSAWAETRGQAPQRRIRLRIDSAAAKLHALPWESLHEGSVMLSAQVDTPFSRYLPIALPWGGPVEERPIRALVIISNPDDIESQYNLSPVDVEAEQANLQSAFESIGPDVLQVPVVPVVGAALHRPEADADRLPGVGVQRYAPQHPVGPVLQRAEGGRRLPRLNAGGRSELFSSRRTRPWKSQKRFT